MTETTNRIIKLQQQKGINDRQLELGAELAVSSLQAWTKGKNGKVMKPSAEAITKLAKYFNVSADYLLCLSDDPAPLDRGNAEQPIAPFAGLTRDEQTLLTAYRQMTEGKKRALFGMLDLDRSD